MKQEKPPHPGEVLQKQFLEPSGLSQNRLSMALHVSARRINEIVQGKRAITADTALRLSTCLGTPPEFWMSLQADYELAQARESLGERLEREIRPISLERRDEADSVERIEATQSPFATD
jgi:addiction module HigA family antidote